MSKKRFTAGIDSLFGELGGQQKSSKEEAEQKTVQAADTPESDDAKHKKGFKADLTAFLKEAFEESLEQKLQEPPRSKSSKNAAKLRPKGGLDALLRSTIEPSKMKLTNKPVRRLTLAFDQKKLEKLKHIARLEQTFLKDIIDEIVEEFIEDYESNKGPIRKP